MTLRKFQDKLRAEGWAKLDNSPGAPYVHPAGGKFYPLEWRNTTGVVWQWFSDRNIKVPVDWQPLSDIAVIEKELENEM